MTAPDVVLLPDGRVDILSCSPAWWVAHGTRLSALRPVRLVKLTHYPDDPVGDDSRSAVDPDTGYYTFDPWPGVSFTVPPDAYDPTSWDYDRDGPVPPYSWSLPMTGQD